MEESQEEEDKEDMVALRLYGEAYLTCIKFKKGDALLTKLGTANLGT
jgi:hypothetical protein